MEKSAITVLLHSTHPCHFNRWLVHFLAFCITSFSQEENAKLRKEVAQLESAVKEKGAAASLAESKLTAAEAHSKIAMAEAQVGCTTQESMGKRNRDNHYYRRKVAVMSLSFLLSMQALYLHWQRPRWDAQPKK